MSPPPRRLSFAVGTTLLSASLATGVGGCKKQTVNEGPHEPPDETVNVAHEQVDEPSPDEHAEEPAHVNEGPEADPEPAEEPPHVNTVPPE